MFSEKICLSSGHISQLIFWLQYRLYGVVISSLSLFSMFLCFLESQWLPFCLHNSLRRGFKFNLSTGSLQWKGTGMTYYNCFSFSNQPISLEKIHNHWSLNYLVKCGIHNYFAFPYSILPIYNASKEWLFIN